MELQHVKSVFSPILSVLLILLLVLIPDLRPYFWGIHSILESMNWDSLAILFLILVILLILGYLLNKYILFPLQKTHQIELGHTPVVDAVQQHNKFYLFLIYPLTLLLEESLFRGILFYFIAIYISDLYCIIVTAAVFGAYHIHVYLMSKNGKLTAVYICYGFVLGLFLGFTVEYLGIIGSFAFHFILVSLIYYEWNQKISNQNR